jgi:hypothetical protein
VPELRRGERGVQAIYLAIGSYGAIGAAPFGIDEVREDQAVRLRRAYRQLAAISEDIVGAQQRDAICGFLAAPGRPSQVDLGGYRFTVTPDGMPVEGGPPQETGYGVILKVAENQFLAAGYGFWLWPRTLAGEEVILHTVQELGLEPGVSRAEGLPVVRWLNGDETLSGRMVRVSNDTPFDFPSEIPVSRSMTGVVRFSLLPAP